MSPAPGEPAAVDLAAVPAPPPPRRQRDVVAPEDLNVAPALLGQPLARPGRRAAAMAIDGLCIAAFNALGNAWVALALAALWLVQRSRRAAAAAVSTPAPQGMTEGVADRPWRAAGVAALLLGLGALTHQEEDSRGTAGQREEAVVTAGEVAREVDAALAEAGVAPPAPVASALAAVAARQAASAAASAPASLAASEASMATAPASASEPRARERLEVRALRARVKAQEEELQRLRSPGLGAWQARARHWLDELGEGWLWSLAYFTLLPAGWLGGRPGQTLGKRLLGLRVAELTGKPMTPMRNLKRYGGYAAGMATGGLGLLQLLWDANRQAIQDKTAHTVVLDLRRAAATVPPAAAQPADGALPQG